MTPGPGIDRRHGQQPSRGVRQRIDGEARWQLVDGGVVATRQHAAAEVPARGHRVDPGDRVPVVAVALVHHRQEVLEVRRPLGVDGAAARLDRQQADRGVEDHAGEAHPADRRPEQLGARPVRSRRPSRRRGAVTGGSRWTRRSRRRGGSCRGCRWRSAPPTVTKRVPGDTGTKKPRGTRTCEQLVEADAGRHGRRPRDRVQDGVVGVVVETQHRAPAVLRGIAVGAPHPPDDAATPGQVLDRRPESLDVA